MQMEVEGWFHPSTAYDLTDDMVKHRMDIECERNGGYGRAFLKASDGPH